MVGVIARRRRGSAGGPPAVAGRRSEIGKPAKSAYWSTGVAHDSSPPPKKVEKKPVDLQLIGRAVGHPALVKPADRSAGPVTSPSDARGVELDPLLDRHPLVRGKNQHPRPSEVP